MQHRLDVALMPPARKGQKTRNAAKLDIDSIGEFLLNCAFPEVEIFREPTASRRAESRAPYSPRPEHRRPPRHRSRGPGSRRGPQGHRAPDRHRLGGRQVLLGHASRVRRVRNQPSTRAAVGGHRQGGGPPTFDRGLARGRPEGAGMRPTDISKALEIGRASVYRVLGSDGH